MFSRAPLFLEPFCHFLLHKNAQLAAQIPRTIALSPTLALPADALLAGVQSLYKSVILSHKKEPIKSPHDLAFARALFSALLRSPPPGLAEEPLYLHLHDGEAVLSQRKSTREFPLHNALRTIFSKHAALCSRAVQESTINDERLQIALFCVALCRQFELMQRHLPSLIISKLPHFALPLPNHFNSWHFSLTFARNLDDTSFEERLLSCMFDRLAQLDAQIVTSSLRLRARRQQGILFDEAAFKFEWLFELLH